MYLVYDSYILLYVYGCRSQEVDDTLKMMYLIQVSKYLTSWHKVESTWKFRKKLIYYILLAQVLASGKKSLHRQGHTP